MSMKRGISHFYGQSKRIRQICTSQKENEGSKEDSSCINRAESCMIAIKNLIPVEKTCFRLPPIILVHQVYSMLENRTVADKEISLLVRKGTIRVFKLGFKDNTLVAIFSEDFNHHVMARVCPCQVETNNVKEMDETDSPKKSVEDQPLLTIDKCKSSSKVLNKSDTRTCQHSQTVARYIYEVLPKLQDVSVDKELLRSEFNFTENDLRSLMNVGLLAVRSVGSYWLSFPNAGEFMKRFSKGRAALVRMIKKCKFSEILRPELEKRQLGKACTFGMKYHIHDLIGADIVQCIETTSGTLLRIAATNA